VSRVGEWWQVGELKRDDSDRSWVNPGKASRNDSDEKYIIL
jgi:hypothetical protein